MAEPTDPWSIDTGDDTTGGGWQLKMIGGIPWLFNSKTGALMPSPSGYEPAGQGFNFGGLYDWTKNLFGNITSGQTPSAMPSLMAPTYSPTYDWGGTGSGGGGGGSYMSYDPFSQQLQAAQLQESIRQANLAYGMDRAKYLQSVLATPANVFSSFFTARGQVPPYNAQLANILNIPNGGNPFFGSLPDMGQTPGIPGIPQPQGPQAISMAKGGTYIPAEPAVAIGLKSGNPLFTFNENAPQQTEKVKITPQKVPSFQEGGTITADRRLADAQNQYQMFPFYLPNYQGMQFPPYYMSPFYGNSQGPQFLPSTGSGGYLPSFAGGGTAFSIPPGPYGSEPLPPLPAPVQDLYNRDFPQFPYLTNLSQGQGLGIPQLGNAMQGFPVPSMQSLNRMLPSEQTSLFDFFNTVLGIPAADVAWAAQYPFMNLRSATPALQRIQ